MPQFVWWQVENVRIMWNLVEETKGKNLNIYFSTLNLKILNDYYNDLNKIDRQLKTIWNPKIHLVAIEVTAQVRWSLLKGNFSFTNISIFLEKKCFSFWSIGINTWKFSFPFLTVIHYLRMFKESWWRFLGAIWFFFSNSQISS